MGSCWKACFMSLCRLHCCYAVLRNDVWLIDWIVAGRGRERQKARHTCHSFLLLWCTQCTGDVFRWQLNEEFLSGDLHYPVIHAMSMAWFKEWEAFVKAKTDSELLGLFHPSPFTPLHWFSDCVVGWGGGLGGWLCVCVCTFMWLLINTGCLLLCFQFSCVFLFVSFICYFISYLVICLPTSIGTYIDHGCVKDSTVTTFWSAERSSDNGMDFVVHCWNRERKRKIVHCLRIIFHARFLSHMFQFVHIAKLKLWGSPSVGWDGSACSHFPTTVHTVDIVQVYN